MPNKKKFVRSKGNKRTFHGNRYAKVEKIDDSVVPKGEEIGKTSASILTASSSSNEATSTSEFRSLPASKRKLDCDLSSEDDEDSCNGYRLIDISDLMSIFKTFLCPECKSNHIVMKEDISAKMGLVSQLSLECSAEMCSYSMFFFSSSRVNNKSKTFEANRKAVLAIRNIGVGHQGLVNFCGVMNMLTPKF